MVVKHVNLINALIMVIITIQLNIVGICMVDLLGRPIMLVKLYNTSLTYI